MRIQRKSLWALLILLAVLIVPTEAHGIEQQGDAIAPLLKVEDRGLEQGGARAMGLLFVVAILGYSAFLWYRKRGRTQGTTIRVVAVRPLGQKEKIAVLEVLGERMVVGVTAHQISLLSQAPASFSELIGHKDERS